METPRRWKVGEIASLAHVTVRTLHHYDAIGLLVPSERTRSGTRLYSEVDVARLHEILLYRELDFSLESIRRVLDEPAIDRHAALRSQRALLVERRRRTDVLLRAVDRALESMTEERSMSTKELFEGFEDLADAPDEVRAHHAEHAEEAHERWGKTDAYAESMRRVKGYGRKDWARIQEEGAENEARMAALMSAGGSPEGTEAMEVAEAMRRHIGRWFYPCSHERHAGLADMYEADERFTAYYETRAEGLAGFVAQAIRANALRAWEEGAG